MRYFTCFFHTNSLKSGVSVSYTCSIPQFGQAIFHIVSSHMDWWLPNGTAHWRIHGEDPVLNKIWKVECLYGTAYLGQFGDKRRIILFLTWLVKDLEKENDKSS